MKTLFIHQNFPGQYLHLAPALARKGHQVRALGMRSPAVQLPGVQAETYGLLHKPLPQQHGLLQEVESKMLRAEAVAAACTRLAQQGFEPDVIAVHPAWGESMYLRSVWPSVPQLHFNEFYYRGDDTGFDPEFPAPESVNHVRRTMKNLVLLESLENMDQGMCPTQWQCQTLPAAYAHKVRVVHDGINTQVASPNPQAVFEAKTQAGVALRLTAADEVVSFVSRVLEPYRGYHRFLRALPALLHNRPAAQVVLVGGRDGGYGVQPQGTTHQQRYWEEVLPQLSAEQAARVHFVGRVPHPALIQLFRVTSAHVYLTYPFVLSWSLLEAMACGAPVIGSDTAPVREVVRDGHNGVLVDFFDTDALAKAMVQALEKRALHRQLGAHARQTVVQRYDLKTVCLPEQLRCVEALVL